MTAGYRDFRVSTQLSGMGNRYNFRRAAGPQLLLHLDGARPAVVAGRIAFGLGFDESVEPH